MHGVDHSGAIAVSRATGADLAHAIPHVAALRVEVFREWPYLYDGDVEYERRYLKTYLHSPRAAIITARDGSGIVGACTCLPMHDETEAVQAPFLARGWDLSQLFYFGESLLRPAWRGRGIGVRFFAEREAHARSVPGCRLTCFCSVLRPADHPARPPGAVPLDAFWTRRGYTRRPDLVCEMSWKQVGGDRPVTNRLVFWMKSLDGSALP